MQTIHLLNTEMPVSVGPRWVEKKAGVVDSLSHYGSGHMVRDEKEGRVGHARFQAGEGNAGYISTMVLGRESRLEDSSVPDSDTL